MSDIKTIICLKELEEKEILEDKDIVIFTVKEEIIEYHVWQRFLNRDACNGYIFDILKINNRYKIAKKAYGYKQTGQPDCQWPESKENDFSALTRLVKELYLIIEEQKPIYTKFTRFEIMEI